jgi:hypothetical protein
MSNQYHLKILHHVEVYVVKNLLNLRKIYNHDFDEEKYFFELKKMDF